MTNTNIFQVINLDETVTDWVKIDHGNNEFTCVLKSVYDEQQAAQSTPMVSDEAPSI